MLKIDWDECGWDDTTIHQTSLPNDIQINQIILTTGHLQAPLHTDLCEHLLRFLCSPIISQFFLIVIGYRCIYMAKFCCEKASDIDSGSVSLSRLVLCDINKICVLSPKMAKTKWSKKYRWRTRFRKNTSPMQMPLNAVYSTCTAISKLDCNSQRVSWLCKLAFFS